MTHWLRIPSTVSTTGFLDKARNGNHGLIGNMLKLQKSFVFQGSMDELGTKLSPSSALTTLTSFLFRVSTKHILRLLKFVRADISSLNIRLIPTTLTGGSSLSLFELMNVVETDVTPNLVPIYLCLNLEMTLTMVVDLVKSLAFVAKGYVIWLLVDATYEGSACICPEF
ncbi:hypothetical protein GQ457_06G023510 [Hibiscus cannabinus]